MTDPVFSIAVAGLGLSAIVSAIRLFSWFLHSDPKAIAQAGRLSAIGLFALSLPLLFGLVANQKWVEAIGLSAVMLLAFAFYGPQVLGRLFPRRLVADFGPPAPAHATAASAGYDTELVQRSIAVLEEYLRHTTAITGKNGTLHSRGRLSRIAHARGQGGGNGHDEEHRDQETGNQEPGVSLMTEAEALAVLGLSAGAAEAEIAEQHRRLMQLIHPDRGGSPYFAVKVNQAKEALLGRDQPRNGASSAARKRRRRASEQDLSQSKPATRG
jgi:hypothetical protein